MQKILLVGGAGYVGSVLAEELSERGHSVTILDRLYYGDDGISSLDNIKVIVQDMRTVDPEIFEGVDTVVNVGGLSNDPTAEYNPRANYEMNTVAARTLADLCRQNGVRRYVFASSCSIYDRGVSDDSKDEIQTELSEVNPESGYSSSKFEAERLLLELSGDDFCPVILRKGTIFGFSPRMRYDLVANTFVKDAMSKGSINLFNGGEMWRPLIEVRDVARAYATVIEANESKVKGEIFNIALRNLRISELALRVREALRVQGIDFDIQPIYDHQNVRSYRVSCDKIRNTLGFEAEVTVEQAVEDMVQKIRHQNLTDFGNPKYYNIQWMKRLEQSQLASGVSRSVFDA